MSKKVEIIQKKEVKSKKPTIIEGFPSVGLVGAIATEFIAGELEMEEIGFMSSSELPPVVLVKDGQPKAPIRLYAKGDLVVIVSDTAVPSNLAQEIAEVIVDWAKEINAERIISIGGIQHPEEEEEEEELKVYSLSPFPEQLKKAGDEGIKKVDLGFLTGVMGLIMMECVEKDFPVLGLLADAHYGYPDPAAAAKVIKELKKITEIEVDTKPLEEASEKIEKRFATLMKTAKKAMKGGKKEKSSYPTMYG